MPRTRVHESDPARQKAYRTRRNQKIERYDFAMILLRRIENEWEPGKSHGPGLQAEIKKFLDEEYHADV